MLTLTTGTEFDGYRLVRLLGKGGMGEVYLAEDLVLDRYVAIKFIASPDAKSEAHKRFILEARAIARLQHPNVVSIYRIGETHGRHYLASEYIRGSALDEIETPVEFNQLIHIATHIACGLAAAHRRGVVHRDIKPANAILSEEGETKLLDFGIAKLIEPTSDPRQEFESTLSVKKPERMISALDTLDLNSFSNPQQTDAAFGQTMLTFPGAIMGTPSYMAPEVLSGEPATFRSDIYSFGALLFFLCTGRPPHSGNTIAELWTKVISQDAKPLSDVLGGIDPAFEKLVQRCLNRNPALRYANGNEMRAALMQFTPETRRNIVPEGNPYRGLHAFEMEHQNLFFGRDSEIRMVLERLSVEPFVLVAGDSGVGKSSLCRAGVLPRVNDWFEKNRNWHIATMIPGKRPVTSLAVVIAKHLQRNVEQTIQALIDDPSRVVRDLQAGLTEKNGLVIFVDQLEELVTHAQDEEQEVMREILIWFSSPLPSLRLLATIRSDFLGRLADKLQLSDELSRALYFLRALSTERIREAIVGPAQAKGVGFDSEELIDKLAHATMEASGGLPLLQFALAELWETRDKSTQVIGEADLEAIGGVSGALSRHADNVVAQMVPAARQAVRALMIQFVTSDGTRARKTEIEIDAQHPHNAAALDALIRGRLVVVRDTPEGPCFEIAHEALISGWTQLAQWLSADADAKIIRERLQSAVSEWIRLEHAKETLWSQRQLSETAGLQNLTDREREFLRASARAAKHKRMLRILLLLGAPILIGLIYTGIHLKSRLDLNRRVDNLMGKANSIIEIIHQTQQQADQLYQVAIDLFDHQKEEAAEQVWSEYLKTTAKIRPEYAKASQLLETAIFLDPNRPAVRDRFAMVLYERVRSARPLHTSIEKDELIQRLGLYDQTGQWSRMLNQPGTVMIQTTTDNPTIELMQYFLNEKNNYGLKILEAMVKPSTEIQLAPGSYLFTLQAPERATVRYPFMVHSGQKLNFTVSQPRMEDLPPGFVYIPPGRFMFGSAAEDAQRKEFFHHVPIHEVETSGYLIATHETTFAEWITFLESIPQPRQIEFLPRIDKGGFQGALSLQKSTDGWTLSFQPSSTTYSAIAGKKISYPGRTKRKHQNWLQFPVFGISVSEAEAYTKWLDESGRVKGARLCTEYEWERAARGADNREFPNGFTLGPDQANYDDTYEKNPQGMGPDEVGSYPQSQSPFGIYDMAGNVWEWTRSSLAPGKYTARGGSYYFGMNSSRTTDREETEPSFRDVSVGFRVCADFQASIE